MIENQIEKWAIEKKLALVKSPPVFPKPIYKNETNLVKLDTFCEFFWKKTSILTLKKQPFLKNQQICSIQTSLREKAVNSKRKTKFSKFLKSTTNS